MVAFGVPVNWYLLQIVPAFVLTWIMMLWSGYVIAMACVRYRDIIQVITNWLMVLFFLTPVMWKPDFLPPEYHFIIDYNPLAQFLELLRNPFWGSRSAPIPGRDHRDRVRRRPVGLAGDRPLPATRDLLDVGRGHGAMARISLQAGRRRFPDRQCGVAIAPAAALPGARRAS